MLAKSNVLRNWPLLFGQERSAWRWIAPVVDIAVVAINKQMVKFLILSEKEVLHLVIFVSLYLSPGIASEVENQSINSKKAVWFARNETNTELCDTAEWVTCRCLVISSLLDSSLIKSQLSSSLNRKYCPFSGNRVLCFWHLWLTDLICVILGSNNRSSGVDAGTEFLCARMHFDFEWKCPSEKP